MSDQPTELRSPALGPNPAPDPMLTPPGSGWFQRLTSVLFIIFCFELGLFLLIYPWTDGWSDNYFAWAVGGSVQTTWHSFWNNSYVRGCISGLGVVNLWIAVTEVFRMFARRGSRGS
jgi:hypothetical protein